MGTLKDDTSKRTDHTAQNQNQGRKGSDTATTQNKTTSPVISLSMEKQVITIHPVSPRNPHLQTNTNSNQTFVSDLTAVTVVRIWSLNTHLRRDTGEVALIQRKMLTDLAHLTHDPTALDQRNLIPALTHTHIMTGSWSHLQLGHKVFHPSQKCRSLWFIYLQRPLIRTSTLRISNRVHLQFLTGKICLSQNLLAKHYLFLP